jgi:hypothetical protein
VGLGGGCGCSAGRARERERVSQREKVKGGGGSRGAAERLQGVTSAFGSGEQEVASAVTGSLHAPAPCSKKKTNDLLQIAPWPLGFS